MSILFPYKSSNGIYIYIYVYLYICIRCMISCAEAQFYNNRAIRNTVAPLDTI